METYDASCYEKDEVCKEIEPYPIASMLRFITGSIFLKQYPDLIVGRGNGISRDDGFYSAFRIITNIKYLDKKDEIYRYMLKILPYVRNTNTCDGGEDFRNYIIEYIGRNGDKNAIQPLLDILNSNDERLVTGWGCEGELHSSITKLFDALKNLGADFNQLSINWDKLLSDYPSEIRDKIEICKDFQEETFPATQKIDCILSVRMASRVELDLKRTEVMIKHYETLLEKKIQPQLIQDYKRYLYNAKVDKEIFKKQLHKIYTNKH